MTDRPQLLHVSGTEGDTPADNLASLARKVQHLQNAQIDHFKLTQNQNKTALNILNSVNAVAKRLDAIESAVKLRTHWGYRVGAMALAFIATVALLRIAFKIGGLG